MKRTGEFVLGIIGIIIYAFFTMMGALLVWIQNNADKVKDMMTEVSENDPENAMSVEDLNESLDTLVDSGSGWVVFSAALITTIVGIVALVLLRGNKRPKPAGIILILFAVVSFFVLGQIAIIGAIPYIVVGIMCLVRKAPVPLDEME